ncbi:MAG TPA: hypothetical protein DD666_09890 [Advenella kashmirensis]|uniref:Uncharacterized protein n=1 Tax=Advenella kashmirensis TaxID=310575 RepID=A0A356LFB6_9BURK|nr:hypothetical protein [Advenella kashmirensis]
MNNLAKNVKLNSILSTFRANIVQEVTTKRKDQILTLSATAPEFMLCLDSHELANNAVRGSLRLSKPTYHCGAIKWHEKKAVFLACEKVTSNSPPMTIREIVAIFKGMYYADISLTQIPKIKAIVGTQTR